MPTIVFIFIDSCVSDPVIAVMKGLENGKTHCEKYELLMKQYNSFIFDHIYFLCYNIMIQL